MNGRESYWTGLRRRWCAALGWNKPTQAPSLQEPEAGLNADQILERVCRMPSDFSSIKTISMLQLLAKSGIETRPEILNVPTILPYIRDHPEVIDDWLQYSSNQRVTSAWYFSRESGGYVVRDFPKGEILNFEEARPACAEYIVRCVSRLVELARDIRQKKKPRRRFW